MLKAAINLRYLYLLGSLIFRPRELSFGEAAGGGLAATTAAVATPDGFKRLLLREAAREALLLPFWESCIALAAVSSSF
jgi:hypothetical protein